MGLTDAILIESLTNFPAGWITSGIVVLMVENCCLRECFPRVFMRCSKCLRNIIRPSNSSHSNIFPTSICHELHVSIWLHSSFFLR